MTPTPIGALVVFSGGQDSTTCLAWALSRFDRVETLGFDYGQRHSIELECREAVLAALRGQRPDWAQKLGSDTLLSLDVFRQLGETALTHDVEISMTATGLPSTFVPGRNLVFLTLAGAQAYRRGLKHLVTGVCETDYSGYPDCRDDTMKALQVALNLGMETRLVIDTPLMWLTKGQTWALARDLGGQPFVDLILEHTHTCYRGERGQRHPWGYGCGQCPACQLRAAGWRDYSE
ncbi:preQ(0) biosynthesis protein QueC [Humidesulfovibrio mexicanus]|uniref:7-cyano-7-deazaguanine synthase n=1 Tax=Humidesulfovibrio mexicanus TaxID=147047 RepID=A0A238Z463_9BACT|nr:7-cyano-7-deazaguanine synthase QueC [Humidesulfovibrio mexicanus]SNR78116.1 preQ(0) biosynthesis protein QueC [Humidesulfovibrio mexicanus]